ncbi:calcium-binding protein [Xanthomonas phaseoli]|uniref:calcium-binding protein n=2 Tax=Xanthomonas phaseoli TaxID=1985254 RepID=UPI00123730E9|nr:calcium-binding protein [Xanthomonas phaseoli]MBO9787830.1 calcium-binding protein [Xanthomonas phaseoli pv. dieffenbachiae]MBO9885034.1 calcium-binding protein [Xanthomonas phaseoli pv. dieffenbachiae]MBO9914135.1 calcium-binding protein [Xanthomonas phaseoli pv. dieffenbachiae]MBO9939441.1 calcium-binding protein [Xanthomonas phaseoli pv. dieffenbachiae]MBO9995099.1 calcium-binding protein [Xanthomonas phaseoli pv. dieffenbachiae]
MIPDGNGGFNASGHTVSIGFDTPAGVGVGLDITPNGFVGHPTDPYAGQVPSAKVDLTIDGKFIGSYDIPLAENFTMDDIFDPELGGIGSDGLLGDVYGKLRHRDREINEYLQDATGDNYQSAKGWRRAVDPLVLDLDGDGIETVGASGSILFDHEGNAVKQGTGWISADDGILVLDRNGNGLIDGGAELFGDYTDGAALMAGEKSELSAGLRALSSLDTNKDGFFDSLDEKFFSVQVWRDLNQDGISNAGELFSLNEIGVKNIALTPTSTENVALGNGNAVDSYGYYTRTDGTQGVTGDLLLASNAFHRDFTDEVILTTLSQDFVNVAGSGMVRDLRESISINSNIYYLLKGVTVGATRSSALSEMDGVLLEWANTSSMRSSVDYFNGQSGQKSLDVKGTSVDGHVFDIGHILSVMEKFNGELFFSGGDDDVPLRLGNSTWSPVSSGVRLGFEVVLGQEQTALLMKGYEALRLQLYNGVVLDTRLRDYTDELRLGLNEYGEVVLKMDRVAEKVKDALRTEGNLAAIEDLYDLKEGAGGLPLDWNWVDVLVQLGDLTLDRQDFEKQAKSLMGVIFGSAVEGGSADDVIIGTSGDDSLYGNVGNDTLIGGLGDDSLDGGSGTNQLEGGAGDDVLSVNSQARDSVLIGGTGNDTLSGSWYSDTYVFNKGDGHDTVVETSSYSGAVDKVVFGEGIAAGDVRVLRQGSDVVLDLGNGTDSVRLKDWLSGGNENDASSIEQLVFADGTIWTPATLRAMGLTTLGTDAADTLTGWTGNDILLGGDGNDTLSGGSGTDRLDGGAGDDVLSVNSQARDSVLIGGTGNDTLSGSWYSDTYVFNKGDGHDTVVETSSYSGAVDRVSFGREIRLEDAVFTRSGNDLLIALRDSEDQLAVAGWFSSEAAQVEYLDFRDGSVAASEVSSLIDAMAVANASSASFTVSREMQETRLVLASSPI